MTVFFFTATALLFQMSTMASDLVLSDVGFFSCAFSFTRNRNTYRNDLLKIRELGENTILIRKFLPAFLGDSYLAFSVQHTPNASRLGNRRTKTHIE